MRIKGGLVEGDLFADMPDDALVTADWIKGVKADARQGILARMAADGRPADGAGDLVIVALIPLESPRQDAQKPA